MTTITIPIDVAEAAAEALGNFVSDHGWSDSDMQAMDNLDSYIARHKAIRAELAKPVEPVTPVAWIDDFGSVFPIGARKGAESWIESWIAANQRNWKPLYLHPPTPAWCDAPEVAALKAERDAAMKDAERYRYLCGQQHWSEALEKAIDAAIAKAEGKTE
jgi:hypothetical protein